MCKSVGNFANKESVNKNDCISWVPGSENLSFYVLMTRLELSDRRSGFSVCVPVYIYEHLDMVCMDVCVCMCL